jgi:hypothetical protein
MGGGGGGKSPVQKIDCHSLLLKQFQKKRKENHFFVNFGPVLEFARFRKEEDPFKNQNFFFFFAFFHHLLYSLSVCMSICLSLSQFTRTNI